ncbi:tetratricopeptide repeat protein [Pontibacter sp. 172403-2]|uniref:tetratricopeptide repeat protein n=1 Tax=Pontibacter rufus TaxID=2791028 RepID=UPI0018AFF767|nr:tetratricopeptide repeat protein [Pontibacter sp. 172403-2]MBF9253943.1 tetratricopeptide repeat protein [Pontibacter sp. 172403-2]
MSPSSDKIFSCLVLLLLAFPAFARQQPYDVAAVRRKLEQEREKVKQATGINAAERAGRMLELGLWQEAAQVLQTAKPGAQVKLAKAKLFILQNEFAQADELVQAVLKENPKQREALLLQSKLQVQAWELPEAMATARQVWQANPGDEEAALAIGRILMLQKNYDEALEWAGKVAQQNPDNAAAYLLESDVYFWNQEPELAEAPLIKSLTLNPFDADARFNYGYAIWRRVDATQLNDMAAQWELALALNPLHYVTHWHWGNGHTNLTYADYARPEDEQVRKALETADKLISRNKIPEALEAAAMVQQLYSASVLPAMLRGSAYYMAFDMDRRTRLDSAQAIFQQVLQKKKHYGPAHNALAAVIKQKQLTYLHNYDSLRQVVQQTVIGDPLNFAKVFPDVAYYPGDEVQKMVWSQLYASIVYFPFLSRQSETFVIPPLHHDLAIAMHSPYFRQATTFDNRQWMDIRGVGSGAAAIEYVVRGSYLERNVVLHEYTHLYHQMVFTDAEKREVRRLYFNAMKEGRTLDYYSANNEHEYLAQTYPAYFEPVKVHPLNHKSINTTADLKARDPELYTFLDQLVKRQRAYLAGNKQAMAGNWAQVYLNLVERAQQSGDLDKAAALLDTALTWDAQYQPAILAYAGVKQQQKNYVAAQEWLQKAKSINQGYAPLYVAEAELKEAQKRDGRLKADEALEAQVQLYRKALALEDDLLLRATVNQQFRELYASYDMAPEAMAVAEEYLRDAPVVSTYLRDRRDEAQAFAALMQATVYGDTSAAQPIARLVALKPQDYELRRQYADALAALGRYEAAYATLADAQRVLSAAGAPRADYVLRMAGYKLAQGDKAGAGKDLQPLPEGKAILRGEAYRLAGLYADLGETAKAAAILNRQPEPVTVADARDLKMARAKLWTAQGKLRKAQRVYEQLLQQNPQNREARRQLVQLLQQRGKLKQAGSVEREGVQPQPSYPR